MNSCNTRVASPPIGAAPKSSFFGVRVLLLLVVAVVVSSPARGDPKPRRLVVATWNLEWFYDEYRGDNRSDLAKKQSAPSRQAWEWKRNAVADAIAQIRPDILAVQEVENRNVLRYLCQRIDREHGIKYRIAFIEGYDVFTEQDVAILYRSGLVSYCRHEQSWEMFRSKKYYNVSKHIAGHFEWGEGADKEHLALMNVHLRSRAEGAEVRRRQARLVHAWTSRWLEAGHHVIVTGDFNAEQQADDRSAHRTIGILTGKETPSAADDLIDLHVRLPRERRRTHLLPGKQFDRILVSPSLLPDHSSGSRFRKRLVLQSIRVEPQLVIRGKRDGEEHWKRYFELPERERDVSDHYPVVATFEWRP